MHLLDELNSTGRFIITKRRKAKEFEVEKYKQNSRVVARQVRGDRILVPMASSEEALDSIYVLNETAAFMWDQMTVACTAAEIASRVIDAYDVGEAQAKVDTGVVLADLLAVKAIEVVDA